MSAQTILQARSADWIGRTLTPREAHLLVRVFDHRLPTWIATLLLSWKVVDLRVGVFALGTLWKVKMSSAAEIVEDALSYPGAMAVPAGFFPIGRAGELVVFVDLRRRRKDPRVVAMADCVFAEYDLDDACVELAPRLSEFFAEAVVEGVQFSEPARAARLRV